MFEFGVRSDPEAVDLSRGETLLREGQARAGARRSSSATTRCTRRSRRRSRAGRRTASTTLKRLVATHPRNPVAQLHLGWALLLDGAGGRRRREQFLRVATDVRGHAGGGDGRGHPLSEVRAGPADAHRSASACRARRRVPTSCACWPDARRGRTSQAKLRYGLALWTLWRRVSAERQFEAAATLAPNEPTVAQPRPPSRLHEAAIRCVRFRPARSAHGAFPKAAVVRFHLGLLLLWTRQLAKGAEQFRLAVARRAPLGLRHGGKTVPFEPSSHWDQVGENMSRTAYSATSAAAGIVPHLLSLVLVATKHARGST